MTSSGRRLVPCFSYGAVTDGTGRLACRWGGADTSDGSQFYYNSKVIKIFKDYITVLLSHKNQYTGVCTVAQGRRCRATRVIVRR